jgi:membrane associated rhomboid family serine protease
VPGTGPETRDTFALHGRRAIQLESDGLSHPHSQRGELQVFTRYEDLTHVAASPWGFWLGSAQSSYGVPRQSFVDPQGPEQLVRSLLARLASLPGGASQLARMAEVERAARAPAPVRATWSLLVLCLLLYALQLEQGARLLRAGALVPGFVLDGDLWRLVTANLLHGLPELPLHLGLNMLGLVGLGSLVERVMGPARTVCVMGASGIGAMLAGGLTAPGSLVGASGVVFGLAGALVWLELRFADRLPAWLRIPRHSLALFLIMNGALMLIVPFISGAAHAGGFGAGLCAAALVAGPVLGPRRGPPWVRASCVLVLLATGAALAAAGFDLFGDGDFEARYAERLLRLRHVSPSELEARARELADARDATPEQLALALRLAERAAAETGRRDPELLATLAELQVVLGQSGEALHSIDEAIALAPRERSYRELRQQILERRARERLPDESLPEPWPAWPAPEPPRAPRALEVEGPTAPAAGARATLRT